MKEEMYDERVVLCKDKKQLICNVSRMVYCSNVELREKGTCVFCYDGEKIWVAGWGEAISSDVLFSVSTVDKKMNLCSRSNIGRQVTLFFSSDDRVLYPISLMRISFVKVIYTKSEREEKEKRLKEEAKERLKQLRERLGITKKKKKKKPRKVEVASQCPDTTESKSLQSPIAES